MRKKILTLALLIGLTGCETSTNMENIFPPRIQNITTQPTSQPITKPEPKKINSYVLELKLSGNKIIQKSMEPSSDFYHPLNNPRGDDYSIEIVNEDGKPLSTRYNFSFGDKNIVVIRIPQKNGMARIRTYDNRPKIILETKVR